MGCKYITHTDGKRYLIPDCIPVAHSDDIDDCSCYKVGRKRFNTSEMVYYLKKENKELKRVIKELKENKL